MTGRLVLVSTPIGNLGDLPPRAADALRNSALICCEDTRHTGKLLSHFGIAGVRLAVANEHTETARVAEVVDLLAAGHDVALVTDAGTPAISDPGARLVRAVLDAGQQVTAVPGPAALVMALVVSGFDTTRFVFEGFLPRTGRARRERIAEICAETRTVVFYEAPHRVERTVAELAAACADERQVALARELTKKFEEVWRGTLAAAGAHLAENAPRGEYVVVVEGARPSTGDVSDDELRALLLAQLARDGNRRAAIATVMATTGVGRRRLYDLVVGLPRPDTPS